MSPRGKCRQTFAPVATPPAWFLLDLMWLVSLCHLPHIPTPVVLCSFRPMSPAAIFLYWKSGDATNPSHPASPRLPCARVLTAMALWPALPAELPARSPDRPSIGADQARSWAQTCWHTCPAMQSLRSAFLPLGHCHHLLASCLSVLCMSASAISLSRVASGLHGVCPGPRGSHCSAPALESSMEDMGSDTGSALLRDCSILGSPSADWLVFRGQ